MRRRLVRGAFVLTGTIALLCLAPVGTGALGASAAATRCASELPPGTYGDITVPPNTRCVIDESVITGDIRVLGESTSHPCNQRKAATRCIRGAA